MAIPYFKSSDIAITLDLIQLNRLKETFEKERLQ
jgi:hypothetical protein